MNSNQNKNEPKISEKELKKKGILKILNIIISDDKEDKYNCIMVDGTIKTILASELQ